MDKYLVFATKDFFVDGKIRSRGGSKSQNWDSAKINSNDNFSKIIEPEPKGLKKRLRNLKLSCNIEIAEIPDGIGEGEIWEIIKKVCESIPYNSYLYFDITHSFRFIPMIVPAIISFLKSTKNIKLKSIYYGAFEVLGDMRDVRGMPIEKRIAPVRDLKELYEMIEWSEAVQSFSKYGDERTLKDIINKKTNPQSDKKSVRRLAETLTQTSRNISLLGESARLSNVKDLKKIKNVAGLEKITIDDTPEFYPVLELSKGIRNMLSKWSNDEIKNGFLAARWCLDNQCLAQAITFAHESAISYYCDIFNWDGKDSKKRGAVNFLLSLKRGEKDREGNKKEAIDFREDEHTKKWFLSNYESALNKIEPDELVLKFEDLNTWRNTVNHVKGGDRKKMKDDFPKVLNEYMKKLNIYP